MATGKRDYTDVFWISKPPKPATDPETFKLSHELLTCSRSGYEPFYIPLEDGKVKVGTKIVKDENGTERKTNVAMISGKDPKTAGSWKENRLSFDEAYQRLKNGFNVGIVATEEDPLVIVDVDDMNMVGDTKPTLQVSTRKGLGTHNYYFTDERPRNKKIDVTTFTAKENIPVERAGEVRACWQYVVAPGSFVPVAPAGYYAIPEEDRCNAGKYNLINAVEPANIVFHELPEIYKAERLANVQNELEKEFQKAQKHDIEPDRHSNSAIFSITPRDLYGAYTGRFSSPLHGSETGMNTSMGDGLMHCWRCNVSLSGYACLAVEAGLYDCCQAGKPHRGGSSYLRYDDEEIFEVWKYAKEHRHIPEDDPIPTKALLHYATSNGLCKESDIADGWKLPADAYNRTLAALMGSGINPGRTPLYEGKEEADSDTINKLLFFTGKNFNVRKMGEYVLSLVKCITLDDTDEVLYYDNGVYRRGGERIISQIVQNALGDRSRKNRQNETINWIKNATYVKHGQLNPPTKINLQNGVFDLVSWQILPHTPDSMFTIQHPVNYDPKAKCQKIEQFINEILERDKALTIYEFLGYSLTPQTDIQKAVIVHGRPGAGKSTLLNVCTELLGIENVSSESLQNLENDRFAVANLRNKCLNIFSDLPNMPISDIPIFKQIVGGDRLRGEEKYLPAFTFKPTVKLLFSANSLPPIKSLDGAKSRRLILIRVNGTVPAEKRNLNLIKELTTPEELSGLLNLALNGLERLLENGHYTYETSTEETQIEYLAHSDPVKAFAQQCLTFSASENIAKEIVLAAFVEWCDYYGVEKLSGHRLTKGLRFLGMDEDRETTGKREYHWKECNFSKWGFDKLKSVQVSKNMDEKNHTHEILPSEIEKSRTDEKHEQEKPPSNLLPISLKTNQNELKENNNGIIGYCGKNNNTIGKNANKLDGLTINQDQETRKNPSNFLENTDESWTDLIESCMDQWEESCERPIYSGNAHEAKMDIVKYHKMRGIDSQLIFNAIDNRASLRCVGCGSDDAPNKSENMDKSISHRCTECYQVYQKLNPVKIPDEFNLEEPTGVV